ncbi:MAG: hypothetical protein EXS36_12530 [Pedosphaera sp.]|nr:hypothetical protein [Pedosphaera sp.]
MPIEIIVPRLGWSMEEGAFIAWLKDDGAFVRAGDLLFSIEGDKAVQEIESIDSGILRISAACPKPGGSIHVGDLLGHLVSPDEAALKSAPTISAKASTPSPASESNPIDKTPTIIRRNPGEIISAPRSATAISPRALRVASELGVDWTQVTGSGRSGRIRERDIHAAGSNRSRRPIEGSDTLGT